MTEETSYFGKNNFISNEIYAVNNDNIVTQEYPTYETPFSYSPQCLNQRTNSIPFGVETTVVDGSNIFTKREISDGQIKNNLNTEKFGENLRINYKNDFNNYNGILSQSDISSPYEIERFTTTSFGYTMGVIGIIIVIVIFFFIIKAIYEKSNYNNKAKLPKTDENSTTSGGFW